MPDLGSDVLDLDANLTHNHVDPKQPSGQCPNGSPTLPPSFSPEFDSEGRCWRNLEALGLQVRIVLPSPDLLARWVAPEIGGPVGGPLTLVKKKQIQNMLIFIRSPLIKPTMFYCDGSSQSRSDSTIFIHRLYFNMSTH